MRAIKKNYSTGYKNNTILFYHTVPLSLSLSLSFTLKLISLKLITLFNSSLSTLSSHLSSHLSQAHSHLISQAHLSQLWSLKLTLFIAVSSTHRQRRHHRSSTSLTHQSSQATDQPQTHAAIHLRATSLPPIHFRSVVSIIL